MQSVVAQRSSFAGVAVRSAARTQAPRSAVVVRASPEESRRQVLSGLVAGAVALTAGLQAQAANIDLFDDRKVREKGFDLIYEARDLDLPQSMRDGLDQARGNLAATKKRVSESEKRIDVALEPYISKQYWVLAREELRNQVGTLRFDLKTLVEAKGSKEDKKKATALKDEFLMKTDALDYAIRKKDLVAATGALSATKSSLDAALAYLL